MANGFVAEDMVAICLVLLDGEAHRPVIDLLRAIDAYQEKMGRSFGTIPDDITTALYFLGWDHDFIKSEDRAKEPEEIFTMPFSSLIPLILKKCEAVYFNDSCDNPWDYYREECTPSWRRARLLSCFSKDPAPEEVRELLREIDWNEEMLELFLHNGCEFWREYVYLDDELLPIRRLR